MNITVPNIPTPVRLFLRDALEAAIAALGSLAITIPANLPEAKAQAIIIITAVGAAVLAVFRREGLPLILNAISPKAEPAAGGNEN